MNTADLVRSIDWRCDKCGKSIESVRTNMGPNSATGHAILRVIWECHGKQVWNYLSFDVYSIDSELETARIHMEKRNPFSSLNSDSKVPLVIPDFNLKTHPWLKEPLDKLEIETASNAGAVSDMFINVEPKPAIGVHGFIKNLIDDMAQGLGIPEHLDSDEIQSNSSPNAVFAAPIKYNQQLQQFMNPALGQPWQPTPGDIIPEWQRIMEGPNRGGGIAEKIQYALRAIETPCAVCGNRPGIWVTENKHTGALSVMFECHGDNEAQVITERDFQEHGLNIIPRTIPFFRPKAVMVAPTKPSHIAPTITNAPRLIRLED